MRPNQANQTRVHILSMLILLIGMLGGAGFVFLTQLLLAHTLTVAELGRIAGVMSLMLLATPLIEFGVSGLWLRQFGRDGIKAIDWIKPSLYVTVFSSVVVIISILIIGQFTWQELQQRQLLYLVMLVPVMEAFVVLVGARMQLEGKYRTLSLWQVLPKFSRFIVALTAWGIGLDVYLIAVGYCASSLIIFLISVYKLIPMIAGEIRLENNVVIDDGLRSAPTSRQVIENAWPFALGGIFSLIYLQSDIFLLSALSDNESTGIYSVAFSLIALVYLFPTAIFHKFLLPRYHRWAVHEKKKLLMAYRIGNGTMLVIGIVLMLFLLWAGPFLVNIVFGEKYALAGSVVQVLAACVPFRYLASSIGGCLVTQNHMIRKVKYQMSVAIFNVVLNIALIPDYGIYGAALATVASEILLCFLYLFGAWKHVFGMESFRGWTLNYKLFYKL